MRQKNVQKITVSATAEASRCSSVVELAAEMAKGINARYGAQLAAPERRAAAAAFRSVLIVARRPGRKQSPRITAACRDLEAGVSKIHLFERHIPNWNSLSQWRREHESHRLMEAVRSRQRRARKNPVNSELTDCTTN